MVGNFPARFRWKCERHFLAKEEPAERKHSYPMLTVLTLSGASLTEDRLSASSFRLFSFFPPEGWRPSTRLRQHDLHLARCTRTHPHQYVLDGARPDIHAAQDQQVVGAPGAAQARPMRLQTQGSVQTTTRSCCGSATAGRTRGRCG